LYPVAIFIGGPTASLKTKIASELLAEIPSFIVNADSMQVYDQLKILTNRPKTSFLEKNRCYLFGFVKYPDSCNVGYWQKSSLSLLNKKDNNIPIFVGGTGLYIDSLINNLTNIPEIFSEVKKDIESSLKKFGINFLYKKLQNIDNLYAQKISPNDKQRIVRAIEVKTSTGKSILEWQKNSRKKIFKKILYIVIKTDKEVLYSRINKRCQEMINLGVVEEVNEFIKKKKGNFIHPLHKAIGLSIFENYLNGNLSKDDAISLFMRDTRRYAKRQLTWFNNKANDAIHLDISEIRNYLARNLKL
jgi:tRNA dimethylallyltransferase